MRFIVGVFFWFCLSNITLAERLASSLVFDCKSKIACATNSVVSVLPIWPANVNRSDEPEGTGVVLGDGHIIATADHVIGPAKTVLIRTVGGEVINSAIVIRDPFTDIALLKIVQKLNPMKVAMSPNVGEKACAIGNSFGLNISLTCGVVSAIQVSGVGFNRIEDFVQTDAAVNPGMSGGALINQDGELIGLLSAIFTKKSDSNIGVNFAASSQLLSRVLDDYLTKGSVSRLQPGISVRPSLEQGDTGINGALVAGVDEGSPEANAGLQLGDTIVKFNGRRMNRAGAYVAALALLKKGNIGVMEILRLGKPKTLEINFIK